jgi:hypothetical protein
MPYVKPFRINLEISTLLVAAMIVFPMTAGAQEGSALNPEIVLPPTAIEKDASAEERNDPPRRFRKMRDDSRERMDGTGRKRPPDTGNGETAHFSKFRPFLESIPSEEREQLRRQFHDNPEKYRETMIGRFRQWREQHDRSKSAHSSPVFELRKEYLEATTDEKRQEIRNRIRTFVEKRFDEQIEDNRQKLDTLEQKIAELRAEGKQRQERRESIIEERIDFLLQVPGTSAKP